MRPINRAEPKLPAGAFKTYQILAPVASHFRPATCEEVQCPAFLNGWRTVLDLATQAQLVHTVRTSGRPYRELVDGGTVTFVFEPGLRCFRAAEHVVPLEREPFYIVKGGDHRGDPNGSRPTAHVNADDWVDDFANHQDRLADRIEKG